MRKVSQVFFGVNRFVLGGTGVDLDGEPAGDTLAFDDSEKGGSSTLFDMDRFVLSFWGALWASAHGKSWAGLADCDCRGDGRDFFA